MKITSVMPTRVSATPDVFDIRPLWAWGRSSERDRNMKKPAKADSRRTIALVSKPKRYPTNEPTNGARAPNPKIGRVRLCLWPRPSFKKVTVLMPSANECRTTASNTSMPSCSSAAKLAPMAIPSRKLWRMMLPARI